MSQVTMQDRDSAPPQGQNYSNGSSYDLLTSARRLLVLLFNFRTDFLCVLVW